MLEQPDELVVNLSLVFGFLFFLRYLSLEYFDELGLQKHFLQGDKNLKDHLYDFGLCELEPDAVLNDHLIAYQLVPVQNYQVVQLVVDYFELLPDELLKQKYVPILVNIIQPVYVGPNSPPDLPSICVLEASQAVTIGVNVLQFARVYEVF